MTEVIEEEDMIVVVAIDRRAMIEEGEAGIGGAIEETAVTGETTGGETTTAGIGTEGVAIDIIGETGKDPLLGLAVETVNPERHSKLLLFRVCIALSS